MSLDNLDDIKQFTESLNIDSNILLENINNIKNITSFVKKEYLNNGDFIVSKPRTLFVLENVKVYTAKEKNNRENLINAYNQLLSLTKNATKGTDIIREIKNNNNKMPKNRAEYLVILKECKNIRHVFVDNLEGKFYNIGSYGRGKYEEGN